MLEYIQVTSEEGVVELLATDLENSAKIRLEANVEEKCKFCVNAKNIFEILRELPNGLMKMELRKEENILKLHFGDIHYSLLIYNNSDFPLFKFENDRDRFTLKGEQLLEMIDKTSHAISNDETRLFLNGIFIQKIDNKIRAVATDGHRLSLLETEADDSYIETLINGVIIPRKGVFELKRMAETHLNGIIKFSVDESFVYANANDRYFLSLRLMAKEYPKYQSRIPGKTAFIVRVERKALYDAIRRIRIMSNERFNGVRLKLTKNNMSIVAKHPSLGDAQEKLSIDYEGKEMDIGLNAKYLIDTLSIIGEGDISLELNNEISPIVIKAAQGPNYLGVIMPIKL